MPRQPQQYLARAEIDDVDDAVQSGQREPATVRRESYILGLGRDGTDFLAAVLVALGAILSLPASIASRLYPTGAVSDVATVLLLWAGSALGLLGGLSLLA